MSDKDSIFYTLFIFQCIDKQIQHIFYNPEKNNTQQSSIYGTRDEGKIFINIDTKICIHRMQLSPTMQSFAMFAM